MGVDDLQNTGQSTCPVLGNFMTSTFLANTGQYRIVSDRLALTLPNDRD